MDIRELRKRTRMSQRDFSAFFGIPLGTVRNWEQGISKPPDYVFSMIAIILWRDKMINVETIKFLDMLNRLAKCSKNGIEDFSTAKEGQIHEKVFYDRDEEDEDGRFRVVLDACVIDDPDCFHHDVIDYYDSDETEYTVRVITEDNSSPFIEVSLLISGEVAVVQDGEWYFA